MFDEILPKLKDYPHRVIGDCLLINGDCMEVLPLLGKVDAMLTDPPYGIGDIMLVRGFCASSYPRRLPIAPPQASL